MQYLMWHVLVGLNVEIKMSFLLVGHTKFAPDWCFGLFKRLFRKTKVGCLDDIAAVVEQSATINHPQLVGTHDGTILVPFYNWSEFFDSHMAQTALKGISQMHHFRFSAFNPGVVFVKNSCTFTPQWQHGQSCWWHVVQRHSNATPLVLLSRLIAII